MCGKNAPMAIFHDAAQRPDFRHGDFSVSMLEQTLGQFAKVRLPFTVRHTQQIFEYLARLKSPRTLPLVKGLHAKPHLPHGREVELHQATPGEIPHTVRTIASQWVSEGWCQPHDILILSPHRHQKKTGLAGLQKLGELPLSATDEPKPGYVRFLSINRAKGLDEAAVIVIDLPPFDPKGEPHDQYNHFMAASRARQLLAVVVRVD